MNYDTPSFEDFKVSTTQFFFDLWTLLKNLNCPQLDFLYNFAAKQQGNEYE